MPSIYQMKQQLADLGAELKSVSEEIRNKAGDPAAKLEELRELKQNQNQTEERFLMLKEELEKQEKEERSKLEQRHPVFAANNDEHRMVAAKADLIRSSITGRVMSDEARNLLGAKQNSSSGGEKFLPTTLTNELISEPLTKNPLRSITRMTHVKGLEVPKIAFSLDDDGFIGDEETAKELKISGDKVSFGRHKFKVKARISDTVLHGSDLNLTSYVENALRSGLAAKEKKIAFTDAPVTGEEHMSFYSSHNRIKEVTGEDLLQAIKNAIADLHEDYRENAKVVMKYGDYLSIIESLSNKNINFYNAQPEQILGKPAIFCDSAILPIVGDFQYAHLNYDGAMIYDSDKDVDRGEYLFVLTAWIDMQLLLKSAFRIVMVTAATPTPTPSPSTYSSKKNANKDKDWGSNKGTELNKEPGLNKMLHELKNYMRIDESEDDELLAFLMEAAKDYLSNSGVKETNHSLYRLAIMLYVALHYENRDPSLKMDRFNFALDSIILQLKSSSNQ